MFRKLLQVAIALSVFTGTWERNLRSGHIKRIENILRTSNNERTDENHDEKSRDNGDRSNEIIGIEPLNSYLNRLANTNKLDRFDDDDDDEDNEDRYDDENQERSFADNLDLLDDNHDRYDNDNRNHYSNYKRGRTNNNNQDDQFLIDLDHLLSENQDRFNNDNQDRYNNDVRSLVKNIKKNKIKNEDRDELLDNDDDSSFADHQYRYDNDNRNRLKNYKRDRTNNDDRERLFDDNRLLSDNQDRYTIDNLNRLKKYKRDRINNDERDRQFFTDLDRLLSENQDRISNNNQDRFSNDNQGRYGNDVRSWFRNIKRDRIDNDNLDQLFNDNHDRFNNDNQDRFSNDNQGRYGNDVRSWFRNIKRDRIDNDNLDRSFNDNHDRFNNDNQDRNGNDVRSWFRSIKRDRVSSDNLHRSFNDDQDRINNENQDRYDNDNRNRLFDDNQDRLFEDNIDQLFYDREDRLNNDKRDGYVNDIWVYNDNQDRLNDDHQDRLDDDDIETFLRKKSEDLCQKTGRCGCYAGAGRCGESDVEQKTVSDIRNLLDVLEVKLNRESRLNKLANQDSIEKNTLNANNDISKLTDLIRDENYIIGSNRNKLKDDRNFDNHVDVVMINDLANIDEVLRESGFLKSDLEDVTNDEFVDLTRYDAKPRGTVKAVVLDLGKYYNESGNRNNKFGSERSSSVFPHSERMNPQDFFNLFGKLKEKVTRDLVKYVVSKKAKKPNLNIMNFNQKERISILKGEMRRNIEGRTINHVRSEVENILFGPGGRINIVPSDTTDNKVIVPNWMYRIVKDENARYTRSPKKKRMLPLTNRQKSRLIAQQKRLAPLVGKFWRRNFNQKSQKYGLPFQVALQGLAQYHD